jgi:Protein of unknown function (DUF3303)
LEKREKGEKEVMRFILKFSFPTTDETNQWIRDGSIGQKMESILESIQPEAAYFCPVDGTRGGYLIVNMDDASQLPPLVEPFFQELGANVEVVPAMTQEDLRTGLQNLQ